jgi:hypothetical protein
MTWEDVVLCLDLDMKLAILDGILDQPKQEQMRPSKWNNPYKNKADLSVLENQIIMTREQAARLKQESASETTKNEPKPEQKILFSFSSQEKAASKSEHVEPWLKTSPDVPIASATKNSRCDGAIVKRCGSTSQ